jgi:hypothetical protein
MPQPISYGLQQLGVPEHSKNLFSRIIRNPVRPDRPMRERRCTEMFCATLMNCPVVRDVLFRWLAERAGQDIPESTCIAHCP